MIISTIIHGLDVAALLLVGLLTYQLVKCYRAFYANNGADTSVSGAVSQDAVKQVEEPVHAFEISGQEAPLDSGKSDTLAASGSVDSAQAAANAPSAQESASKAILNDYIGGFFAEASTPDIQAFRASPATQSLTESSDQATSGLEQETLLDEEISVSKAQLAEFKAPETIEPVLVKPVRVVDLDEEDTFIVVEDENVHCHASNENVMSDKVVMAMLKEANMVASS